MKILIVEDDLDYLEVIRRVIEIREPEATIVECINEHEAYQQLIKGEFDIILTDLYLGKTAPFTYLKELHRLAVSTPIIVHSGSEIDIDEIKVLEVGVEDYIPKPSKPDILLLRIRKAIANHENSDTINSNGYEVNLITRTVSYQNKTIKLTPKEFDVLYFLIRNKNTIYSRQELIRLVWSGAKEGIDERVIDRQIVSLRRKINAGDYIQTILKCGYAWVEKSK